METIEIRNNLFNTLRRLDLYRPEPSWEDIIMEGYRQSLKNFGIADTALVSPKAKKDLLKLLKSKK